MVICNQYIIILLEMFYHLNLIVIHTYLILNIIAYYLIQI